MSDDPLPKIGAPAARALASLGVTSLAQVAACRVEDLLALHGFGPRAAEILRVALAQHGLTFLEE